MNKIEYPEFQRGAQGRPLVADPVSGEQLAYERPSHFDVITDESGLVDWKMRSVVAGLAQSANLLEQAARLDPKKDARALTRIAYEALRASGGSAGADRGTFLHLLTETNDWGDPIECVDQEALDDLAAYRATMTDHGITVVPGMIEVRAVNDVVRAAGTIDRIVHVPGLGTVIGDLKCGQTLTYSARKYAIQLAIYANSVLYDPATGKRSPMPDGLRTDVGVIMFLPAGQRRCEIHEVDLRPAWEMAQLCAEIYAHRNTDARPLLSRRNRPGLLLPSDLPSLASPSPLGGEAAPAPTASTTTDVHPVQGAAPGKGARRDWVWGRLRALPAEAKSDMAMLWPDGVPGFTGTHQHTDAELDALCAVLDKVEAKHVVPFGDSDPLLYRPIPKPQPAPAQRTATIAPDEGDPADPDALAALRRLLESMPDDERQRVIVWNQEANAAGRSFSLSVNPSVRRFEILRAAIRCTEFLRDDELIRAALKEVMGGDEPLMPAITIGACLGALTIAEAASLANTADGFGAGRVEVSVADDGSVRLLAA